MPQIQPDVDGVQSIAEDLPPQPNLGNYVEVRSLSGRYMPVRIHHTSRNFEIWDPSASRAEIPSADYGIEFDSVGPLEIEDNEERDYVKIPLQSSAQPTRPMGISQDAAETYSAHPDIRVERCRSIVLGNNSPGPEFPIPCPLDLCRRLEVLA